MNPIRQPLPTAILAALVHPLSVVKSTFLPIIAIATIFFHSMSGNAAIMANLPGAYYYGWSPYDNTPDWNADATHTPNIVYANDGNGMLLVNDSSVGTVTWQFQAAPGLAFASNMGVQSRETFFGVATAADSITGSWSSDGITYTPFLSYNGGDPTTDHYPYVSLSASGYTGSQNLYVQFALKNTTGYPTLVQAFRLNYPGDMFFVDGTVIAVPEPAAVTLIGLALGTLLMRRQRAQNRPVH